MIAAGFPPDYVWKLTPRQLQAFQFIARKRREVERAESLSLGTLAARGEPREVKRLIREWTRDG